ncbi:MAG: 3',5'-nucleoside bisphosphate phosphatase [Burkholderiaceae bacterium]
MNADLHCHSVVSDGTLKPEDVVERAHRNRVEILALTDHDEVGGLAGAQARARQLGMAFVPGVEVSVTWAGDTIHIVGLRIDFRDPALLAGLERTRMGRDGRAQEIAEDLAKAGVPDAYEGALRYAGNPELISRSHFARYIVETGTCETVDEVFRRFLVEGKPGYVAHRWAKLSEAVAWIRAAGGTAVLAHPGRYRLSDMCLDELITEFRDVGGEAIEVMSGSHTPDQYGEFAAIAQRFGLKASRGSDFHGPGESRHDLGSMPALPKQLRPVWAEWPESVVLERG